MIIEFVCLIVGCLFGYLAAQKLLKNKFSSNNDLTIVALKKEIELIKQEHSSELKKINDIHDLNIENIKTINKKEIENLYDRIDKIKQDHDKEITIKEASHNDIVEQIKVHHTKETQSLLDRIKEKTEDQEKIIKNLLPNFENIASKTLKNTAKEFQDISKKTFSDDHKVIKEWTERFDKLGKTVDSYETQVKTSHSSIQKDLRAFHKAFDSSPNVRGEYGQESLRNSLESHGMIKHTDFIEQDNFTRDDEKLIPDCIIKLPDNRNLAIDAKAPMFHYKAAVETEDKKISNGYLKKHAEAVRSHMKKLSEKAYWDRIKSHSPQFVIMYIPGDHFYLSALQFDHKLQADAFKLNVIISCPSLLFGHLKVAANMWSQFYADENVKDIIGEAKELHSRWAGMQDHIISLGKSVGSVQKHFNGFVGSYSRKLLPQIDRFKKYGVDSGKIIQHIDEVDGDIKNVKLITEESQKKPQIMKELI